MWFHFHPITDYKAFFFNVIIGKFFILSKISSYTYLGLIDDYCVILNTLALSEMRIINRKEPWYFGYILWADK